MGFLLIATQVEDIWHATIDQIIIEGVFFIVIAFIELFVGQRVHPYLISTPSEFADDVAGEEFGIAARHIDIEIPLPQQTIQQALEIFDFLNLIQKNVISIVIDRFIHDIGVEGQSVFR